MSTAAKYDEYWKSGLHVTHEWTEEFFKESLGVLVGKSCVLDYGCGLGYSYQRHLAGHVKQYIAADISDVALETAAKRGFSKVKIREDSTVDLPAEHCDGAVCSEVFEHLWDPLAAAREIHRVLAPGGVLVATVPNFGYLPWRLLALLRAQVPMEAEKENRFRGVHIRFFSCLMLRRLLRDAGFRDVKIYSWCDTSLWHVFWCAGPIATVSVWAQRYLPSFLHGRFLRIWPNFFGQRLRAVAIK